MADTAAFFAKKKKGGKKKSFKAFNANKIDAKTISSTVHVDAPAISGTSAKAPDLPIANMTLAENTNISNDQNQQSSDKNNEGWEDGAIRSNVVITNKNSVAELLDMNALEERRREQDDIAERMRLEETKAALAAARKGMQKEGQRLKNEQQQKKKVEVAPAASSDGNLGKWVPVHLRSKPSAALGNSRLMMSKARGKSALPDTGDAMDFPDLASANAALEAQKRLEKERQEKERQRAAAKSSGIKSWSVSRPPVTSAPPVRKKIEVRPPKSSTTAESAKVKTTSIETKAKVVEKAPTPVPAAPPAVTSAPAPAPTLKKKKKKKKDLSTFKSSA